MCYSIKDVLQNKHPKQNKVSKTSNISVVMLIVLESLHDVVLVNF